jgi:hypothetical protein
MNLRFQYLRSGGLDGINIRDPTMGVCEQQTHKITLTVRNGNIPGGFQNSLLIIIINYTVP